MSLVVDQEYSKLEVVGIDTFADRACKKKVAVIHTSEDCYQKKSFWITLSLYLLNV